MNTCTHEFEPMMNSDNEYVCSLCGISQIFEFKSCRDDKRLILEDIDEKGGENGI